MKPIRILISGGGTGGHIFPAISIADTFKERYPDSEIVFIGAQNRMEMHRVPAAGYQIIGLPISGINRSNVFKNMSLPWKLVKSLKKAKKILLEFKPDVVVGVGGYASGPTLWVASSLGIPTLIQEQNSFAGMTNKFLSKRVSTVCVAYDGMEQFFPNQHIVLTGNPIRKDLETSPEIKEMALSYFNLTPLKKTVLVIGGSLGARSINNGISAGLQQLIDADIQLIWQTGKVYNESIGQQLSNIETNGLVWFADFISRMDYAYAAADLVVSRAGASSISELCLLKKPAILVPSPNVAEDHQRKNAMAVVGKNAAVMVEDKEVDKLLVKTITDLIKNTDKLRLYSKQIGTLAQNRSAECIVDEIVKLIGKKA